MKHAVNIAQHETCSKHVKHSDSLSKRQEMLTVLVTTLNLQKIGLTQLLFFIQHE